MINFDVVGLGLNATDTLLLVSEFPPYAGKVAFDREMLSPGGQVATAMVCCSRLGLRTKYIGTVGDDLRGDIQRQSLEGTGVDIGSVIIRPNCPNQTAYIIIDERTGERTILWQRAGALRLTPDEINPADIIHSRMLHIDGYDIEASVHATRIARQHGVPVSIDVDTIYPNFEPVLQNVDYLIAGSGWPAKWTGESDPFKALTALESEYHMKVAAMTLGDYGSLARYGGRWYYSPAFEVTCLDTTGAGDVYHGAFCYAILEGMPLQQALEFANAAAALNCKAIGARGNIPSRSDVDALIAKGRTGKVRRREDPDICARVAAQAAASGAGNGPALSARDSEKMIPLRALLRRSSPPVVVLGIILLNILAFLAAPPRSALSDHYSLVPDHLRVLTLFTYMFLHGGWLHIIGNMWFLWVFGSHLENALGSVRFLGFYLACGVAAGALQSLLNLGSPIATLGASGAIAGVMGAFLIIYPRVRVVTLVFIIIFITTVEIPAAFMLLYWFAIQLVSGLTSMGRFSNGGGVAWFAHVGGFLAGILLIKLMPARRFLYDARS